MTVSPMARPVPAEQPAPVELELVVRIDAGVGVDEIPPRNPLRRDPR